ncbi:2-phosphosulfolactate phosphatase [Microterricola viridarii]|uniref:Probable 2-phosphosulfolactate phosphatase n=1 Tax=Microterricola viridarii TaxID=412690 RepID=A0A0Y0MT88_9MICO|nr:2-phosphosulfolactate phosphatase [Microterricola viridarii]AMB57637.1 hypothetical protein AWU67_00810 [Microterricola viridarii]
MSTAAVIPPAPTAQAKYQVRFDWGLAGAARIAPGADVLVWVDVLGPAWRARQGIEDAAAAPAQTPTEVPAALPPHIPVLRAGFGNAAATARWITDLQHRLGHRAMIAIVAAGESETDGVRFAVEDQLAAGAVIDALATLGTDYCSPEAAASCAAFTGLRGAVAHLLTASASAQQLVAAGVAPAQIRAAGVLDSEEQADVVRG